MNSVTFLPLLAIIAVCIAIAARLTTAELDEIQRRHRADAEMRRAIEAERRKAAALRGPRVLRP